MRASFAHIIVHCCPVVSVDCALAQAYTCTLHTQHEQFAWKCEKKKLREKKNRFAERRWRWIVRSQRKPNDNFGMRCASCVYGGRYTRWLTKCVNRSKTTRRNQLLLLSSSDTICSVDRAVSVVYGAVHSDAMSVTLWTHSTHIDSLLDVMYTIVCDDCVCDYDNWIAFTDTRRNYDVVSDSICRSTFGVNVMKSTLCHVITFRRQILNSRGAIV